MNVRMSQHRSINRRANINHQHYTPFEHPYDIVTMRAESVQITDYIRSVPKKPKKQKWKKRTKVFRKTPDKDTVT